MSNSQNRSRLSDAEMIKMRREGYTAQQIADRAGVSKWTVQHRLLRAGARKNRRWRNDSFARIPRPPGVTAKFGTREHAEQCNRLFVEAMQRAGYGRAEAA